MRIGILWSSIELVPSRELRHRDFVLVRMASPRAVHQAGRFVLLVFGENRQGPCVELRVVAAWIQSRHAADSQHSVLVADLWHQRAQILEEGPIVWNSVA